MERCISDLASRMGSNAAPGLTRLFRQLGLDDHKAQTLERHRTKIGLASLQAESAIQQVLAARQDYDQHVRAVLNEKTYKAYRDFEERRAGLHEYGLIEPYAVRMGFRVDPELRNKVVDVVMAVHGYTEEFWHGPYDGLPQVAIGHEAVASKHREEALRIARAAERIPEAANVVALPKAYVSLLESYYSYRQELFTPKEGRPPQPSVWGARSESGVFSGAPPH